MSPAEHQRRRGMILPPPAQEWDDLDELVAEEAAPSETRKQREVDRLFRILDDLGGEE